MRNLRFIVMAALAAILVGTALAYWLNPPAKLPVLDHEAPSDMLADGKPKLKGLSYTQVTDGVKKWRLEADSGRLDEKEGLITLFDVKITFFPDKGGWMRIRAKRGDYDQKNKLVVLKGRVRGRSHDGMTLATEALTYSEADQAVDTDYPVQVKGRRFKIRSKGMKVFVPDEKVVFKRNVDSTFIPEGSGPPPGVTAEDTNDDKADTKQRED